MPLLADTIVECGRRTLTNAINLANKWGSEVGNRWYGCTVIYGDTDSVFVKLPGRTVDEAFDFGNDFCAAVTADNPPPIQLKLEKVYLGCILQTVSDLRLDMCTVEEVVVVVHCLSPLDERRRKDTAE
jgi:DNA polymerase zeta